MAAKITGAPLIVNGAPGEVHTTARNPLGMVAQGFDAEGNFAEYVYLQGVASVIVGSVVTYDEAGVTTLLAANAKGPVAVATAIVDATTEYGWFAITGTFPVDTVANSADNSTVGRETSDGKVGDGRAAGDEINNWIQRAATTAAAVVNHQFNRPFVNDFTGA